MKHNHTPGHKKHIQMTRAFITEIEQALIRAQLYELRVEQERRELDNRFEMKVLCDDVTRERESEATS